MPADPMSTETEPVAEGWPDEHMAEAAWGLIANAYHGNWDTEAPDDWRQAAVRWREAYHRSLASPEPSEPPPGVYRNRNPKRGVWLNDGEGWNCTNLLHPRPWDEIKHLAGELVPLFTVDELIPDPDDPAAVNAMLEDAFADGLLAIGDSTRTMVHADFVLALRVLRNRAVSRG